MMTGEGTGTSTLCSLMEEDEAPQFVEPQSMNVATSRPKVRLLLHCVDGIIPYLTPALVGACFPVEEVQDVLLLGLAVRDTCVVPMYAPPPPASFSMNDAANQAEDEHHVVINPPPRSHKKRKLRQMKHQQQQANTNQSTSKKPRGYTFSDAVLPDPWIRPYPRVTVPCFDLLQNHLHGNNSSSMNTSSANLPVADNAEYLQPPNIFPSASSTNPMHTFANNIRSYNNTTTTNTSSATTTNQSGVFVWTLNGRLILTPEMYAGACRGLASSVQVSLYNYVVIPPSIALQGNSQDSQVDYTIPNHHDVEDHEDKDDDKDDTKTAGINVTPQHHEDAVETATATSSLMAASTSTLLKWQKKAQGGIQTNRSWLRHLVQNIKKDTHGPSAIPQEANGPPKSHPMTDKSVWATLVVPTMATWTSQTATGLDEKCPPAERQVHDDGAITQDYIQQQLSWIQEFPKENDRDSLSNLPTDDAARQGAIHGLAIVGWQHQPDPNQRRCVLRHITQETAAFCPSWPVAVLTTPTFQHVLDALQSSCSVVGSDLPRQWASRKEAFCCPLELLTYTTENHQNKKTNDHKKDAKRLAGSILNDSDQRIALNADGCVSLDPKLYCRSQSSSNDAEAIADGIMTHPWTKDMGPLVTGCKCMTCRLHSRAYLVHLVAAQELLAEILLFVHNLHHMLNMFRSWDEANHQ